MTKRSHDLSGQTFGQLTVLSFAFMRNESAHWHCVCTCGNSTTVSGGHLKSGHTNSCGCRRVAVSTTLNFKHGHNRDDNNRSPEHVAWGNMLKRCGEGNAINPHRYGQRGISVCESWLLFENFLKDMGQRPSSLHSLERIDNDLGYCKSNCTWATKSEQARNRSTTLHSTLNGVTRPLIAWCEILNLDYRIVRQRIYKLKWGHERALTTPTNRGFAAPHD